MFYDCYADEPGSHELDFRFELFTNEPWFMFANHGLNLADLATSIDLSRLGSSFYLVELRMPFTLEEVAADPGLFREQFGIDPTVIYDQYLWFDVPGLTRFFHSTREVNELDFVLLGMQGPALAQEDFQRSVEALFQAGNPALIQEHWQGSWLHTHDNHFFWLVSQAPGLLRQLIAESVLGFFHHVHSHSYSPVPTALVDRIIAEYHTAPIVCFPDEWVKGKQVPVGVQVNERRVAALLETAESSWIAYQLNPPQHLIGRGILVSYDLHTEAWSFEEWS